MNLVVDASVAVKWFLPENLTEAADRLLTGGYALSAPDLVLVEVANTLWKKVRLGEMDESDADEALASLSAGTIELQSTAPLVPRALKIAHDTGHPVYDCVYLAAAEAKKAVVVTADRRFYETVNATNWTRYIAHLDRPLDPA